MSRGSEGRAHELSAGADILAQPPGGFAGAAAIALRAGKMVDVQIRPLCSLPSYSYPSLISKRNRFPKH